MNTKTLTNNELTNEIRRDRSSTKYLEITGIGKNNIKNLIPRGNQQVLRTSLEPKRSRSGYDDNEDDG